MLFAFNQEFFFFFYHLGTSSPFASMLTIFFAEWFPYLVLATVVLYESFRHEHDEEIVRTLLRTTLVLTFIWLVALSLKHYFPSPRPFAYFTDVIPLVSEPDAYGSFPSAHATIFGALAGIVYAQRFPFRIWYLVAAILIAIARVCAGVHWPVDVIVGIFFGFSSGYLLTILFLRKRTTIVTQK